MSETLLMAVRNGFEAEPVVVDTGSPGRIVVRLDDGVELDFDAREFVFAASTEGFA